MTGILVRPPEHYVFGEYVLVHGAVADLLERHANLDEFRRKVRGSNAVLDNTLVALHLGAVTWRSSGDGTKPAAPSEPAADSTQARTWATSAEAARQLGVTQRAVLKAIDTGKLAASKVDGRWQIQPEDLTHYRNNRKAGT